MNKLFDQLCKEKDRIRDVVFPEIDRQEETAYQNHDIEGMKEVIRKRKAVNQRLSEIVKLMEHIVEE